MHENSEAQFTERYEKLSNAVLGNLYYPEFDVGFIGLVRFYDAAPLV